MKMYEMKPAAKELAVRLVGRRVANRLGYPDVHAMEDTAARLCRRSRRTWEFGYPRGTWNDFARTLEGLLEEAARTGEVRRMQASDFGRRGGSHE